MTERIGGAYKAPYETSSAQRAAIGRLSAKVELVTQRIVEREDGRPLVLVTVDKPDRETPPERHNPKPTETTEILLLGWDGEPRRRARLRRDESTGERAWELHTLARHRAGAKPQRTGPPRYLPWPEPGEQRRATLLAVTSWVEKGGTTTP